MEQKAEGMDPAEAGVRVGKVTIDALRNDRLWMGGVDFTVCFASLLVLAILPLSYLSGVSLLDRLLFFALLPSGLLFLIAFFLGVYESDVRFQLPRLIERLSIATGLLAIGSVAVYRHNLDATDAITHAVLTLGVALAAILAARLWVSYGVGPKAIKPKYLVLGSGEKIQRMWEMVRDSRDIDVHGFILTNADMSAGSTPIPEDRILRPIGALCEYALAEGITAFVIADDEPLNVRSLEDLIACRLRGIEVFNDPAFFEQMSKMIDIEHLSPNWLLFAKGFSRDYVSAAVKRAFDATISLIFFIMLMPLALMVMVAIKLDSPGPVFYRQTRMGLYGRPFTILKFRSMAVDAESDGVERWAQENDARITRVGDFIRKTHIDELPQILNVLVGDMSFVGPRPERPMFDAELSREIPLFAARHNVKPGITGWAQVNYPYCASIEDAREKLKYDLYYIKNYNLTLDMIIILKTVKIVLLQDGSR